MSSSLVLLGRQPALGLAELESLYGAARVRPVGTVAAQVETDVDLSRLGGAIKLCEVLEIVDSSDWRKAESKAATALGTVVRTMPEGKIQLGLSVYGWPLRPEQVLAAGLSLKKSLRKIGMSVRLTPNKEPALSTAQVQHNHLTGPTGCELVIVKDGEQAILARTIAVQDIDSYTLRDRGRPKRDPRVGMLPPKLAQIIINLARPDNPRGTVLDPFCGTGVVLQEALLAGYEAYGTDIEKRMIDYSKANLEWAANHFAAMPTYRLEQGDATTHQWQPPIDAVACETYLGRPFTSTPGSEVLAQTVSECNTIIKKFLHNIHEQLPPGSPLCIAVPAWQTSSGKFKHLPLIDQMDDLGYNRMSFEHVRDDQLLYYREDQIVARQLLVITRK